MFELPRPLTRYVFDQVDVCRTVKADGIELKHTLTLSGAELNRIARTVIGFK